MRYEKPWLACYLGENTLFANPISSNCNNLMDNFQIIKLLLARELIALCLELLVLHLKYMGNLIMMARNMSSCYPGMYPISPQQELMEAQDEELITWLRDGVPREKKGGQVRRWMEIRLAIVGTVLVYRPSLKLTAETPEKWMCWKGIRLPFLGCPAYVQGLSLL